MAIVCNAVIQNTTIMSGSYELLFFTSFFSSFSHTIVYIISFLMRFCFSSQQKHEAQAWFSLLFLQCL